MIILDTNVTSEMLRPGRDMRVLAWLDSQREETLFFTSIGLAETLHGLAIMPDGNRRRDLNARTIDFLEATFGNRLLPFDSDAAESFATIGSAMRSRGVAISVFDCQVAAIATVHLFAVATRDEAPFRAAGLRVINPWTAA
jgi:hypothetical protein